MSIHFKHRRMMAPDITARKGGDPIVALTSYHAHTAAIADNHCDFLLVGDSLGMVMHGYKSTVPVPLDLMIMHGRAVVRGSKRSLVVIDMPFGTYEESPPVAFRNAARVMKETDCGAVKLEGGRRMAETVRYLVDRGIPVMAHIGLTPQSVNVLGDSKRRDRASINGRRSRKMPGWWPKPARSRWCWKPWPRPSPSGSPRPFPFRRSESARRPDATGRFWSWRICSGCRRTFRNS